MNILLTGGSGFIGRALTQSLTSRGDQVLWLQHKTLSPNAPNGVRQLLSLEEIDIHIDAVVNLAGAPIIDKKWTEERKAVLRASRIDTTQKLVTWIANEWDRPSVLISGSAIGYYGSQSDAFLGESAAVKPGFAHDLCKDWENAAFAAQEYGLRVCCIRTGIVLGDGGTLAKMWWPFQLGLGGPIASGQQWMSWIHLHDQVRAILFLIDHQTLNGAFNLTAPHPVRNKDFVQQLAKYLKRPSFLPMPQIILDFLMGESSELLTQGQRVVPEKLELAGFEFLFPKLNPALAHILKITPLES